MGLCHLYFVGCGGVLGHPDELSSTAEMCRQTIPVRVTPPESIKTTVRPADASSRISLETASRVSADTGSKSQVGCSRRTIDRAPCHLYNQSWKVGSPAGRKRGRSHHGRSR